MYSAIPCAIQTNFEMFYEKTYLHLPDLRCMSFTFSPKLQLFKGAEKPLGLGSRDVSRWFYLPRLWDLRGGEVPFWAPVSPPGRRTYRAYSAPSSRSGEPVEGVYRVGKRASLGTFAFPSLNSSICVMDMMSKSSP